MAYTRFRNGLDITTAAAVDKRIYLTKAEMLTAEDNFNLPDVYFAVCPDDGKLYLYNVNNVASAETGKFKQIESTINFEKPSTEESKANLLKAIVEKSQAKLFCVGDDWQAIYRFAGSDISLFTDFEKYFGYTKILKIEKTYRNSQNLIDEASHFVLQNPLQLKKDLRSDKNLDYPLVFWGYDEDPCKTLQFAVNKIISEFGVNSSILILGRTNYEKEILKKSGLFKIYTNNRKECIEYIPAPEVQIDFLSVHKSKGLEADNVILLNFKNDKLGFPNQIADDKVLNLVLTNAEKLSMIIPATI